MYQNIRIIMNSLSPRSSALRQYYFLCHLLMQAKPAGIFITFARKDQKINPTPFEWNFLKEGRVMRLHHVLSQTTENKVQKAVMRWMKETHEAGGVSARESVCARDSHEPYKRSNHHFLFKFVSSFVGRKPQNSQFTTHATEQTSENNTKVIKYS